MEEEEDIIDLGPDVLESSNTLVYAEVEDDDDQSLVKEGHKEGLTEEFRGQDGEERTEVNGDQENEEGIYVNEWLTERTEVEEGSIKMVVGGQENEEIYETQEQETSVNQEQEVIYANEQQEGIQEQEGIYANEEQEGIQEQEGIYANEEQEEIYRNQEQEQIYTSQELEVFVNQELEIYVNQEGILNEDDDEIQKEDEQENGQHESNEEVEQENGLDESSEEAFVEEEVEFDPKIPTTHPMLLAELNVHVYNGHLNSNAIFSEQYKV